MYGVQLTNQERLSMSDILEDEVDDKVMAILTREIVGQGKPCEFVWELDLFLWHCETMLACSVV